MPRPTAANANAGADSRQQRGKWRLRERKAKATARTSLAKENSPGAQAPRTNTGNEHHNNAQDATDLRRKKSRAAEAGVAVTCTNPSSSIESWPQVLYKREASSKQSTAACKPVAWRRAPLIIILATLRAVSATKEGWPRLAHLCWRHAASAFSPGGTRQRRASCCTRGASRSWPYNAAMIRILRKFPQVVRSSTAGYPRTGIPSKQKFSTTVETVRSDPATTSRTAASTSLPCVASNSSARSTAPSTPNFGIPCTAGVNIHVSNCSTLDSTERLASMSPSSSSATTMPSRSTTCQASSAASRESATDASPP
mmetsp:Transcript_9502/g.23680  ORF Transcript_9502/g.23680 Transcript_9502/m.23680 type:complete len:312 (+) Transcript_9502:431-1366(+)